MPATLLKTLLREKHWQRYETFVVQFSRAADELADIDGDFALSTLSVSRRQLERWCSGDIASQPRPNQCRVLEHLLGRPIAELLAPAAAAAQAKPDSDEQSFTTQQPFTTPQPASDAAEGSHRPWTPGAARSGVPITQRWVSEPPFLAPELRINPQGAASDRSSASGHPMASSPPAAHGDHSAARSIQPADEHLAATRTGDSVSAGPAEVIPATEVTETLRTSARAASSFLMWTGNGGISSGVLDQLHDDVSGLAAAYPSRAAVQIVPELVQTQTDLLTLLEKWQQPSHMREMTFMAGVVSAMLGKASQDLGDYASALSHARLALVFAEGSGHKGLEGWIYGLHSIINYWRQDVDKAVTFARRGTDVLAAAGYSGGSVMAWLPSLEARAHALRGDELSAAAARTQAAMQRERVGGDELDELGGLLGFSRTKEGYYLAESQVLVDTGSAESIAIAEAALQHYADASSPDWIFSDEAGARCVLALALVKSGEIQAAHSVLEPLFESDEAMHISGIVRSLGRVGEALADEKLATDPAAIDLRLAMHEFTPVSPFVPRLVRPAV